MACGFFGKLPASGDFVARGLPAGVQRVIDRWITHHLAEFASVPDLWPKGGLHAVIDGAVTPIALLIIPSQDAAGRRYPLAIYAPGKDADRAGIERWAQGVHPLAFCAIRDSQSADMLQLELDRCPPPDAAPVALAPPALWGMDTETDPQTTLRTLFNSV